MPFKPLLSLLSAGALAATALAGGALRADPVTLRFEARVERVSRDSIPVALPFDVEAGDVIRGAFTFEPLDVASSIKRTEVVQPFEISFEIGTFAFSVADYMATSIDDWDIVAVDIPAGGIYYDPEDRIELTRRLGVSGVPLGLQVGFAFSFFGFADRLDGADLPANLAAWQRFDVASMSLNFTNAERTASVILTSRVSTLAVPEPHAIAACILSFATLGVTRRERNAGMRG